jgi:two-component system phosphate regulon sensor histidine kinase PhoR
MFRRLLAAFLLFAFVTVGGACVVVWAASTPRQVALGLTLVLAVSVGLGVWLSFTLSQHFSQPLSQLITAVEKIAEGAGPGRVYPPRDEEVSELGQTFNRVSGHLAQRIADLEEDRQKMRAILGGMVEGVVALDDSQRLVFANERACELLELGEPPPVGRPLYEVVRSRPLLDAVQAALFSPDPHRAEVAFGPAARSLTVHAARLPGQPPRGAVLVLHDTSELRRLERVRQEFVANVSHELKTPLSVIKACVETLIDGAVDDVQHRGRFLERVAAQAERLHALILDLLSLARIESGSEVLDFQAVPLRHAAQDAIGRHLPRAEAKGQSLELAPGGEDTEAWADEDAIHHILDNLLDNAVKYTPEGGAVRVRVWSEGDSARVEVQDNGIGIPASDLPRVFERFYRVDKARSRELGGTGLGLSIVKHLAQSMRGTVGASSTPGAGTTFVVSLPRAGLNPATSSHKTHERPLQ